MTNEEATNVLNAPEKVEIEKLIIDELLALQASFNANMADKENSKEQKNAIKEVIRVIDKRIENIDPLFYEQIKQARD